MWLIKGIGIFVQKLHAVCAIYSQCFSSLDNTADGCTSEVAQDSYSLLSALVGGLQRLVGKEAIRQLNYLQEQGPLRGVGEPCDMSLYRCPWTFFFFLMYLVRLLHTGRGHGHIQSSELNVERYFPSMFYRHCKITFFKLDLHSPLCSELCRVSDWTRHNILACKTLGLLQITLN